jgi:hypothetical protein
VLRVFALRLVVLWCWLSARKVDSSAKDLCVGSVQSSSVESAWACMTSILGCFMWTCIHKLRRSRDQTAHETVGGCGSASLHLPRVRTASDNFGFRGTWEIRCKATQNYARSARHGNTATSKAPGADIDTECARDEAAAINAHVEARTRSAVDTVMAYLVDSVKAV